MSDVSRRAFLRTGLTLAAAGSIVAVLPDVAFGATPLAPGRVDLTRGSFEALVGRALRVVGGGRDAVLVVTSVDDIRPAEAAGDQHRFSVTFRGSRRGAIDQGVYRFVGRGLGAFDLLIVPVDRGAKARYYQAVINRPS
jgi:hypothetical protein